MRLILLLWLYMLAHHTRAFTNSRLLKRPVLSNSKQRCWKDHRVHPKLSNCAVCMNADGPVGAFTAIFETTENWNFVLVGSALAFGSFFEYTVEIIESRVPERMLPVVQQSLIQFATLGFVGLVIESIETSESAELLEGVSSRFLGDPDFLLTRFEELHEGLFDVTIVYFGACTLLILRNLAQFKEWDYERRLTYLDFRVREYDWKQKRRRNPQGNETFTLRGWSQAAKKMEIQELGYGAFIDEIFSSYDARVAEFLRFRERFIEQSRRQSINLPRSFSFSTYLQEHSSKNLKQLVSVEAKTLAVMWTPLAFASWTCELLGLSFSGISFDNLALDEAVEITDIEGVFLISQVILSAWAVGNFWKMQQVKSLLRPQLAQRKCNDTGKIVRRLLPPSYTLFGARSGTWGVLEPVAKILEQPYAEPPRNAHEELFGLVGANGPDYYLQSQKLVLFNAIASIGFNNVFFSHPNTAWLSTVVLMPAALSIMISPVTFLMYNWVTAVESLKDEDALRLVLRTQRESAFQSKLRALSRLCDCFEKVATGGLIQAKPKLSPDPSGLLEELLELDKNDELIDADELLNLVRVFDIVDDDLDGAISPSELTLLAHNLGYELSDAAKENFFRQATDRFDMDDGIVFSEFVSVVLQQHNQIFDNTLTERGERLFKFFDINKGGTITIEEMASRLRKMGIDTAGVEQLFVDITGMPQNIITQDEFTAYLSASRMLEAA